jgi:thioesterase domain-containing protein/acyl carrier protein
MVEHAGILPADGVRALTRILSVAAPTAVIAVSQPLEDSSRIAAASSRPAESSKAAPSNEGVEGTLALWCEELLGVEHVGLDDDFFALGGHSLVGVRLFAKIKKVYQVDLQLAVLFEARTVRQLADLIHKAQQPVAAAEERIWSSLVPIQSSGSHVPLFFVHAVGGDVLNYQPLARALGTQQPFYAFRSPHITRNEIIETSIEELASIYVKELRDFYPQGPYLLGGGSLGGIIAFEMAQQLRAQGAEPALVILFDTSAPGSVQRVETAEKMQAFWSRFRAQGVSYLMRKIALKGEDVWQRVLKQRQNAAGFYYRKANRDVPLSLRYHQAQQAHWRALMAYKIKTYPGKIALMRAVERGYLGMEVLGGREDPLLGWGNLALGELEIYDVPGEHGNMLREPHVLTVAEEISKILSKTETKVADHQPVA